MPSASHVAYSIPSTRGARDRTVGGRHCWNPVNLLQQSTNTPQPMEQSRTWLQTALLCRAVLEHIMDFQLLTPRSLAAATITPSSSAIRHPNGSRSGVFSCTNVPPVTVLYAQPPPIDTTKTPSMATVTLTLTTSACCAPAVARAMRQHPTRRQVQSAGWSSLSPPSFTMKTNPTPSL